MGSWHPQERRKHPQGYRGQPMTLANMRQNGVRSLAVTCAICRHAALLNVDAFADSIPVPAFSPRLICTRCGIVGADARPNWRERSAEASLTGAQWR
jgi:hypothetical protein